MTTRNNVSRHSRTVALLNSQGPYKLKPDKIAAWREEVHTEFHSWYINHVPMQGHSLESIQTTYILLDGFKK